MFTATSFIEVMLIMKTFIEHAKQAIIILPEVIINSTCRYNLIYDIKKLIDRLVGFGHLDTIFLQF